MAEVSRQDFPREVAADIHQEAAVDTRREAAADTRQEAEADIPQEAAVDTLEAVDMEAAADTPEAVDMEEAAVAVDTNKFRLDIKLTKANTSTNSCCTKLKKFYCNKRTWAVADMEEDTAADMVVDTESHLNMELHLHLPTAHPDMAVADALSELISVMLFRDIKSLNT